MPTDPSAIPPAEWLYEAQKLVCEAMAKMDRRTRVYKKLSRAVSLLPREPLPAIFKEKYK